MINKQVIIDGEHDMNYCEDNNCKHYGNKEQCEKTHCYYRCYSKLYTAYKAKEQECKKLKKELISFMNGDYCDNGCSLRQQLDKLKAENEKLKEENFTFEQLIKEYEKYGAIEEIIQQLNQLKAENDGLKERINCKCFDLKSNNNRCISYNRIAEDYERDLKKLDKLKKDMKELKKVTCNFKNYCTCNTEKLKQTIIEIKEIAEPYKMTIKKICGNCKKYDDCQACCYKDINCYKYTSPKTNACEEFTYLDKFIPNILVNNILQKISECERR